MAKSAIRWHRRCKFWPDRILRDLDKNTFYVSNQLNRPRDLDGKCDQKGKKSNSLSISVISNI